MLTHFFIRNFHLIRSADLTFESGLTIVSGETGSGKSVFLEALGLVLGERVSGDRIHPQASHAELIATFNIGAQPTLETFLQEHLIPVEAGEPLILKRILARKGTHRCLVNETPVSVVTLRALGDKLGLFHHQFDAFSPAQDDTTWIDTYAHLESDIETVRSAYGAWSEARKQLSEWEREQDKLKEKQDFLTQSLDDIIALDPQPDEEDTLLTLRQKSVQKERLQRGLGEAKEALGAVHHHLLMADKVLRKISSSLAQGDTLLSRLDGLFAENEALLETLQDQERELDHPEHTLESIDDRVAELRAFARKHNVAPAELIELWATWQQQIDALEMGEEQRSSYLEQVLTTRQAYERAARQLAQKRREGATMFEKEVMEVLPSLKLSHVTFQVRQTLLDKESEWSAQGMDRLVFHVVTTAQGKGDTLHRVASGGELSRLMLVFKSVLAQHLDVPLLIFDEIDSGTGGSVAQAIGHRLLDVATTKQVITVTHSPQVMASGTHHLKVIRDHIGSPEEVTRFQTLSEEECLQEITALLSGTETTQEARAAAQQLRTQRKKRA